MDEYIGIVRETIERQTKIITWLIIAVIVSTIALVITNVTWGMLWGAYDHTVTTETYTIEQDGEGINTINGSFNE